MWIVDYVKSYLPNIWEIFGLLPENAKILFLGLDNAGKTTLLHLIRDDVIKTHNPTLHPHAEELQLGSKRVRAFDLGGHEAARRIWKDYYAEVDAIMFIVDAADRSRLEEAKHELHALFENPSLQHVPFAILGNKIDIPTACSEDELRNLLQLPVPQWNGNGYNNMPAVASRAGGGALCIFMCTLVHKSGYKEAMNWIKTVLEQKK